MSNSTLERRSAWSKIGVRCTSFIGLISMWFFMIFGCIILFFSQAMWYDINYHMCRSMAILYKSKATLCRCKVTMCRSKVTGSHRMRHVTRMSILTYWIILFILKTKQEWYLLSWPPWILYLKCNTHLKILFELKTRMNEVRRSKPEVLNSKEILMTST